MISKGNSKVVAIFKGSSQILKVYKGSSLVYQKTPDNYILYKTNLTDTDSTLDVRFQDWQSVIVSGYTGDEFKQIAIPNNETHFGQLFKYAPPSALTEVDMSNVKTQITVGHTMFMGCENLTFVNVADLDVSQCVSLGNTFDSCSSLTELDLENWEVHNPELFYCTFSGCTNLQYLNCPNFEFTENLTENKYWFSGCNSLNHIRCKKAFRDWCWENQDYISLPEAMREGGDGWWEIIDAVNIPVKTNHIKGTTTNNNAVVLHINNEGISITPKNLSFDYEVTTPITSLYQLVFNKPTLRTIDLSDLNTSNCTNMSEMIYYGTRMLEINLENFDTSSCTNMSSMFEKTSVSDLDLSSFNTINVTNMSNMFRDCEWLGEIDLSNFNTSNVTNMVNMFRGCSRIDTIDIRNFDISNCTSFAYMFDGCTSLTKIICSQAFYDYAITNPLTFCYPDDVEWEIV